MQYAYSKMEYSTLGGVILDSLKVFKLSQETSLALEKILKWIQVRLTQKFHNDRPSKG